MEPILAESASRPGRGVVIAVALSVVASFFLMIPRHPRPAPREHHQLPRMGKCMQSSYAYLTR
jgi:hypothetical protein